MQITIPQLVDLFCATKQTEGRTLKTINWYRSFLIKFSDYLTDGNGSEPTLKEFTLDCIGSA